MKAIPPYEQLLEKIAVLEAQNKRKDEAILQRDEEIRNKNMRIAYLERLLYSPKSDKILSKVPNNQPGLFDDYFNEAMDEKIEEIKNICSEIKKETDKRRDKTRKAPSRPAKYRYYGLEERTRLEIPDGINPEEYEIIGKDITRILHREPAKVWVEVIERPIYRKKSDKNSPNPDIRQVPPPSAVIGGNHVGADFLAQIIIDKYRYHLPEYRQLKQYADLGVKLASSTINDWVHAVASKLEPLYEVLRKDVCDSDYLQIDEVPWRIADSPGKSRKGYAWQFLDNRPSSRGLYFMYLKGSRSGSIPRAELRHYKGAIQTDGYAVYDYFEEQPNVTLLGCMAHVRRKFTDAQLSHPTLASQACRWINLLYDIEANLKDSNVSFEEIAAERQSKALPIMDAMEAWMEAVHMQCTPSDPMGKALDYAYKLWPRLKRYTADGRYCIDNNPVERMQRPSVMGRKNYLFSKTDSGAIDNAIFYSLIESCDIVGVNALEWMTHALANLREDSNRDELKNLLPYQYKKARE